MYLQVELDDKNLSFFSELLQALKKNEIVKNFKIIDFSKILNIYEKDILEDLKELPKIFGDINKKYK